MDKVQKPSNSGHYKYISIHIEEGCHYEKYRYIDKGKAIPVIDRGEP
jgi:hypothetical protein